MNNEYEILSHLEKNQDTSQRKIAKKTGLSVGTVNLLLKKMVRKGLVKIERLNAKTLRYIITPQGMLEKSRLVYQFIKASYNQIIRIEYALSKVVASPNIGEKREIIFYGPQDEVLEILRISAGNLGFNYHLAVAEGEISEYIARYGSQKLVVIVWDARYAQYLPEELIRINILSIV